jgi:hypothetical protein
LLLSFLLVACITAVVGGPAVAAIFAVACCWHCITAFACVPSISEVFNVGGRPSFAGIHGVVGVTAVAFVPAFARVLAVADVLAVASVPTRVSPFRLKFFFAYKRNEANLDPFHMCFTISL